MVIKTGIMPQGKKFYPYFTIDKQAFYLDNHHTREGAEEELERLETAFTNMVAIKRISPREKKDGTKDKVVSPLDEQVSSMSGGSDIEHTEVKSDNVEMHPMPGNGSSDGGDEQIGSGSVSG